MKKTNSVQAGITVQSRTLKVFNNILLILVVFLILSPMLMLVNISLKPDQEYMYTSVYSLPKDITNISNYIEVFVRAKMLLGFQNTFILCIISTFLGVMMGTMTSYTLSRFKFKFRNFILMAFIVITVVPNITTQTATYTVIKFLGVINTLWAGIILYSAISVLDIYIFLQFAEKIPVELDESAMVDGASYFKIYWSIILPQMKPAIVTVIILKVLFIYNDLFVPYLYMTSTNLKTVSTALMTFQYKVTSRWNVLAAGILMVMIPTLLMYLWLQKYILAGVTSGAVKE